MNKLPGIYNRPQRDSPCPQYKELKGYFISKWQGPPGEKHTYNYFILEDDYYENRWCRGEGYTLFTILVDEKLKTQPSHPFAYGPFIPENQLGDFKIVDWQSSWQP